MRSITRLFFAAILTLCAVSASASCPFPPCTRPCPYEVTSAFLATGSFDDGSTVHINGTTYENCDNDSYEVIEEYVVCPNGPDQPCDARDAFPTWEERTH